MIETLIPRMTEICGPAGVVSDPLELRTYECDGLTVAPLPPRPGRAAARPPSRSRRSWRSAPRAAGPVRGPGIGHRAVRRRAAARPTAC